MENSSEISPTKTSAFRLVTEPVRRIREYLKQKAETEKTCDSIYKDCCLLLEQHGKKIKVHSEGVLNLDIDLDLRPGILPGQTEFFVLKDSVQESEDEKPKQVRIVSLPDEYVRIKLEGEDNVFSVSGSRGTIKRPQDRSLLGGLAGLEQVKRYRKIVDQIKQNFSNKDSSTSSD